jgi:hypothetical protein
MLSLLTKGFIMLVVGVLVVGLAVTLIVSFAPLALLIFAAAFVVKGAIL